MSGFLIALAHVLLGGAFVIFGIRNWRFNVPRLSGILAGKHFPQPQIVVRFGIMLQTLGGLLTLVSIFAPAAGVAGGAGSVWPLFWNGPVAMCSRSGSRSPCLPTA